MHRVTDALRRPPWLPRVAATATALVGLFNVVSALTPDFANRVELLLRWESGEFLPLAHALTLASGVALLVLSAYLARRRRRALLLAVGVLAVAGVLNVAKGLDVEEALACWVLAGALWAGRGAFVVRHDPGFGRVLRTGPALVAITAIASIVAVGVGVSPGQHLTIGRTLDETARLMLLVHGPLAFREHFEWIPTAVGVLAAGTLVALAWMIFRPLAPPPRRSGAARSAAERLVRAHGSDTLSFFKLRRDKSYLLASGGRAFVGYRIESGVMVISGDPVGPADALPALARETRAFAEVRGLRLCVLGASESALDMWRSEGLRAMYLGDEAIVATGQFSLEGRPIRKVRQSVTRVAKAGYTAELSRLGDLTPQAVGELERVSERWRNGEPERGFSMAMDSLQGNHLSDSVVLVARDGDGTVRGFLHFVPLYGRRAMSLSFMRREHDTPNGLTEFMVARAIEALRERDIEELSLNFAAFARWMHSPSNPIERVLGRLAKAFNPYFQIESLYRFNAKFFPRWEPRYLLFEGALGLPRAGLAAVWVEGQLRKPVIGSRGHV
jgi:lysyl-tRNA synthetase class 2